jgi:2-oxoisovalerate dehydrogenase E2 component (dihydrolipoyl transacylase)
MPDVGEGVVETELVQWFVAVGQDIEEDEPLAEVLTDKASIELPSPVAGQIVELLHGPGDKVLVGTELVRIETADAESNGPTEGATQARQPDSPATVLASGPGDASTDAAGQASAAQTTRALASPSVRRRALDAGVDLNQVRGSGPAGRITHEDLDSRLRGEQDGSVPTRGTPSALVEDIPVVGVRRRIAEQMARSKAHIPHITYVDEVDVTEVERLRQSLNERHEAHSTRLTLLSFVARAVVCAVAEHPALNARYDDDAGIVHRYRGIHLGIATQTPRGLLVPVVRHAEVADIWRIATEIKRLATAAIAGEVRREDLSGSTITITSLGALGGLVTTPVINYPEVAIVGVNKMQTRPVWDGQGFVPRTMMNLSSGFDHRIIDGWEAARFVQAIKSFLELPATMFVDGPQ